MAGKRRKLEARYNYQRPIITDVLPFEVPPSFSNGGYFHFLTLYNVRMLQVGGERRVKWDCDSSRLDGVISILFGTTAKNSNTFKTFREMRDGKSIEVRSWSIRPQWTKPFQFNISHKERDFRQLTVIHPRNQLLVADFYNRNSAQMIYQCCRSNFSIRKPSAVVKSTKFSDRMHKEKRASSHDTIEQHDKEYENLGSYFVYKSYSNIFKFYEHYKYHNAEKKFGKLLRLDISKCFDSIYTHSLPWTILGAEATKDNLKVSKGTFGGRFDALLQQMNQGETNGIVIGPEFSRIFAEIILQGVDRRLEEKLSVEDKLSHQSDYEIFRYVDDYFVFFNDDVISEKVTRYLSVLLKEVKLGLNTGKSEILEKPIITSLTIAKNRVGKLFADHFVISESEVDHPHVPNEKVTRFDVEAKSNSLIVQFKTVLVETGVKYNDLLNYVFSAIERRTGRFFDAYDRNLEEHQNPRQLTKAMIGILEFSFFVYAAAPRVNFSLKLSRTIAEMVDRLNRAGVSRDDKNQVLKFAFDNLKREIGRSTQQEYREMETLYLILALKKLGREYTIPQSSLATYLGISVDKDGRFFRKSRLDYFSVTVALLYIGSKGQYRGLRNFIEFDVRQTFEERSAYIGRDAELLMIYLDLQCCPHVSDATKLKLFSYFPLSIFDLPFVRLSAKYWFTNWEDFDLSVELDKKRTREVY